MIIPLKTNQYYTAYEFGSGLFETMLVIEDDILDLEQHLLRLNKSLSFMGVKGQIEKYHIVPKQNKAHAPSEWYILKLIVYCEREDGYYIIIKKPYPYNNTLLSKSVKIALQCGGLHSKNPLNYHKTLNYLDKKILLMRAIEDGYFDVIRTNEQNYIAEGCKSNVFIRLNDTWYTPPLNAGILGGIAREFFILLFRTKKIHLKIVNISEKMYNKADIIMLTNSLIGCVCEYKHGVKKSDKAMIEDFRSQYFWRKK